MSSDILSILQSQAHTFSKGQRLIAKYITESYDKAAFMTASKLGKKVGIDNVHPHRFRRTAATNALRRGMPLEQVSKMLGHANITVTTIYASSTHDEIKEQHNKFIV